jgi:GNAT superfamily N-acetyltransferase
MSAGIAISDLPPTLHAVESSEQKAVARGLIREYLTWIGEIARTSYGLSFDVDTMVASDIEDRAKFYPPSGRFYLLRFGDRYLGVGCLKQLAAGVGEVQRMYVQPPARGLGGGRLIVGRLIEDARTLGYRKLRLESLKALTAAHELYRSVGFVEIDPYSQSSMNEYQPPESLPTYRSSAVFMELSL